MPTFDTPAPINARVEAAAGSVHLIATERTDTVVEVRPYDESRPADVRAAEQTRIYCKNGMLTVAAGRRGLSLGRFGAVDIDIALPSHSRVNVAVASADARADGDYAECRLASASGDLAVDSVTGKVKADSASGLITVQSVDGSVSVSTATGSAGIGRLDGDLTFQTASGDVTIQRLSGHVKAHAASGSVKVDTAVSGGITARTSSGDVEVGIAEGTAASLDLLTGYGTVTNDLQPSDGPADGDDTLVVNVRTGSGDVDIHRSVAAPA